MAISAAKDSEPAPSRRTVSPTATTDGAAIRATGAEAVHPGYGFLAENPKLGEACSETGLVLIGPKPDTIRKMGDKLLARETAKNLSIPVVPGSELVHSFEEAAALSGNLPFFESMRGFGLAVLGRREEAREALEGLKARSRAEYVDPYNLFQVTAALEGLDARLEESEPLAVQPTVRNRAPPPRAAGPFPRRPGSRRRSTGPPLAAGDGHGLGPDL